MLRSFFRYIFLAVAVLAVIDSKIEAWVDTGHMVVAEIARNNLKPQVQTQVDQLLDLWSKAYPESSNFTTCGCWADDIKRNGLSAFDTWHYIDLPYDPENFLAAEKKTLQNAKMTNNNVVWAITQCLDEMASQRAKPFEKAMMLRFLVHFVADAHQPLHCCELFSFKYPDGDQGGNLFILKDGKTLHYFWDIGLGLLEMYNRPLDPSGKRAIQNLARKCTDDYPKERFKEEDLMNPKPQAWVQESFEIASNVCYNIKDGTEPSREYIQNGRDVVRKQLALAGYRLAYILNRIFSGETESKQ